MHSLSSPVSLRLLAKDAMASTVVFLVALPLCLGIALASNAPIISGLLSGIVGGIIIGIISGSHTSVSGPAAGLTAVIAAQIASLGSFETFLVAVFIAGALQILMGLARLGFIAAFFPTSVIKGLLAAIGFILILKQLPHLVGLDGDFEGEMSFFQPDHENTFSELLKMFSNFHMGALAIGFLCLFLLLACERFKIFKNTKVIAPLLVVIFGTLLCDLINNFGSSLMILAEHRVQVPVIQAWAEIDKFFITPNFSSFFDYKVWSAAIVLALVASLETLLNLEAIDKLDPRQRKSPPNRELFAQGIGNMILGLLGGLPTTSVVVRSSVNINANAHTKKSAIFHGLLLLFCVLLFPVILNKIPLSCLAAILIITGFKLTSPKTIKLMWSSGINQFLPFAATFLGIVFTDLLMGVLIGLIVSLFFILKSNLNNPIRIFKEHHLIGEINRIVLANQVSFLNRAVIKDALMQIPDNGQVMIDASDTDYIDADVLDIINDFKNDDAPKRNIIVNTVGFKEHYPVKNAIQFVDYATYELQKSATPQQVLIALKEGNQRVIDGCRIKRDLNRQIMATAQGQFPLAAVLSCIDSRVPVELIFDQGIGDIFSIRMAGNVISERVLGSLEFACAISGAKLIVVMGHTRCGAIAAAVNSYKTNQAIHTTTGCDNLAAIIDDIKKVIINAKSSEIFNNKNMPIHELESYIIKENVRQSIKEIYLRSNALAKLIQQKEIAIVGCIYDIESGAVEFLPDINLIHEQVGKKYPMARADAQPVHG